MAQMVGTLMIDVTLLRQYLMDLLLVVEWAMSVMDWLESPFSLASCILGCNQSGYFLQCMPRYLIMYLVTCHISLNFQEGRGISAFFIF